MEQANEPKFFSCEGCGRIFTWKPTIAGKKAKCACGASLTVPLNAPEAGEPAIKAAATATAPPKRAAPNANVASKTPSRISPNISPKTSPSNYSGPGDKVAAAAQREAPAVRAAAAGPETLEHRPTAKTAKAPGPDPIDPYTGEASDPFRDYIAPAILLASGLGGIGFYAMQKVGTGPVGTLPIPIALTVLLAVTIVKTVAMILASVPLAAVCKVKLGPMRTAILKLAGTIFFGDAAILWLIVVMPSVGMISKKVHWSPQVWLVFYGVALALIYFACFGYMFRRWPAALGFAALMAFVSRLCSFFLLPTAIALVEALPPNGAQPAAANVPAISSQPTSAPVTVQPGQPGPTALDDMISHRIATNQFHIQEGYAWCKTGAADDADKKLISNMYGAGAVKVYMDGFTMYAQLPSDPDKRRACLDLAQAFGHDNGIRGSAATSNLNYEYVVIDLFGERLKGWHPATQP